ncbi:glycosyltransferase family 87 protein [Haloarcula japonica]|uniref:glycosyltransferase family 87 protein n=1 Tax=Haloarcula japonica TaxID=29282 RepID=UPI0039F70A41
MNILADSDRSLVRGTLLFVILAGIIIWLYFTFISAIQASDFQRYYFAAVQAQLGNSFIKPYKLPATSVELHYVYPPITVFLFYPFSYFSPWSTALAIQTVLNLIISIGLAILTIKYIQTQGVEIDRIDKFLISGAFFVGPHAVMTYTQGQVTYYMALALALGYLSLERAEDTQAGVYFAFPAILKIFPALFGLWLLRKKSWKGVLSASLTGISAITLSVIIFGVEMHRRYVEYILTSRSRVNNYQGGLDPNIPLVTPNRLISNVFPEAPSIIFGILPLIIAGAVIAYIYNTDAVTRAPIVVFLVTAISVILATPSYPNYLLMIYFPLVSSMYLFPQLRRMLCLGFVIISVSVGPGEVEAVLDLLMLPSILESAVLSVATPVLTFISPGMLGLTIILLGSMLFATKGNLKRVTKN